ncbi:MAG TPA: enoyl-CoA hydratase-related protein, partial [Thermoanaerobaculia bacterium]|nr:enoyl-CoA hydratase-related protein [Thermoanaerobaculia bacterium]
FGFQEILYSKRDWVATVTMNRPDKYNAYTYRTLQEMTQAFRDAAWDDQVAVVVLTGAGEKAFCTGGDVKEYAEKYVAAPRDYWKYMALFRAYIDAILSTGKPVVARINGVAVGGGNETVLACDLAVIAEHASVGQVGVRVGSVACGGATQWLSLATGDKRAREMLFTNRQVPARQALEWGLVNRVAPTVTREGRLVDAPSAEEIEKARKGRDGYGIDLSRLDAEIDALTAELLATFPECVRYTKQQANFWKDFAWSLTVRHAQDWLALHYTDYEPLEGMTAFARKRPVDFAAVRARATTPGGSPETPWGAHVGECPSCGASGLPSTFRFCGVCGVEVAAAAVTP